MDVQEKKEDVTANEVPSAETQTPFPIVGIGASAGGLAAFEAFFSGMPADSDPGMAFVLVQHLDPTHKSILCDLIRRYTRMKVFEVEDGITVQINCAYIIPPNRNMAFLNGTLQLLEPVEPRGLRMPIDFFFRSLAQDQRERAIAIVLSGTGSDGTLGARSVKGEGGMVMAQSIASCEYDGMSASVIATGLVDYELAPAKMPPQLIAYAAQAFGRELRAVTTMEPESESALKKIFVLLRNQTSHDFSNYKPTTIHRRIERRMAVHQIGTVSDYIKFLQQTPTEVVALFRDLLIGVTNFFRDPEVFKALEEQVVPKVFIGKGSDATIRVWSAACSTGEEAYSLAILLAERQEAMKQSFKVQVFATDIDSQAIATARAGLYPASIAADLSRERMARFFIAEPDGSAYRIHKGIRDMVVFSEHNVIKDPPFSKLDLISCRNLLIYMGGDLQKKLIPMFHYALNPRGMLLLGTSETMGEAGDLFAVLDRKLKLYERKDDFYSAGRLTLSRFFPIVSAVSASLPQASRKAAFPVKLPLRELTEKAILSQLAPATVLVNGQGDILYLHGRTGMYLEPVTGQAGIYNILKMAREGLGMKLTTALREVVVTKEIVRCPGLRVKTNSHFTKVNLTLMPVSTGAAAQPESPLYLVVLEEAESGEQPSVSGEHSSDADESIAALKQELKTKDEYLQSANEQLETSTEELKSSNEEMQSVNEELQSTNEELETSKEELQSVNEELSTINTELQTKVSDLSRANDDMTNLIAGTGIGTIFVDFQLRILRFTPTVSAIINLIPSDLGRPVGHIVSNLIGYSSLVADAKAVLNTLIPKEVEAQTTDGKWYTMRIQPYRTINNVIEGAVITFEDITEMKKTQTARRESEERYGKLFKEAPMGIALIDSLTGHIVEVNSVFARIAGRTMEEMVQIDWMSITHPDDVKEDMDNMALLNAGKTTGFQMEKRYIHRDGTVVWINMTIAPVKVEDKAHPRHLCMIEDISNRKRTEEALRKANDQLRLAVVVRDAHDAITVHDLEGRILAWNPGAVRMYGWSEAEALAMNVIDRIPEGSRGIALTRLLQLSVAKILEPYQTQRIAKDGTVVDVSVISTALVNESGKAYAIATTERAKEGKEYPIANKECPISKEEEEMRKGKERMSNEK